MRAMFTPFVGERTPQKCQQNHGSSVRVCRSRRNVKQAMFYKGKRKPKLRNACLSRNASTPPCLKQKKQQILREMLFVETSVSSLEKRIGSPPVCAGVTAVPTCAARAAQNMSCARLQGHAHVNIGREEGSDDVLFKNKRRVKAAHT